eukprot:1254731-Alexandrium_andersonii.AAC.1
MPSARTALTPTQREALRVVMGRAKQFKEDMIWMDAKDRIVNCLKPVVVKMVLRVFPTLFPEEELMRMTKPKLAELVICGIAAAPVA